ncbi:MAG: ferredoxin [Methanobacterium sp.]|nr:ferredoxin [Methanobacterium sp.]
MKKNDDNGQNLKFKVVVERDKCTSCGSCEDVCPELFELDEVGSTYYWFRKDRK